MKLFITPLLLICFASLNSQTFVTLNQQGADTLLNEFLAKDTILTPEYYQVDISICEYTAYDKKATKHERYRVISLDSIERRLKAEFIKNNIDVHRLSVIELRSLNHYAYLDDGKHTLYQKTYRIYIYSQDTVLMLFDKYKNTLFSGYSAFPVITDSKINTLVAGRQDDYYAIVKSKIDSQALSKNIRLKKPVYKYVTLTRLPEAPVYTSYIEKPLYDINLKPLTYRWQIYLTYSTAKNP